VKLDKKFREKYADFIKGLELHSIQLIKCSMEKDEEFKPTGVELTLNEETSYKKTEEGFAAYISFFLLAERNNGEKFAINASYKVHYRTSVSITKKMFEIFAKSTLILHIWPYFRQLVHDLTVRAGLPPLVLPIIKMIK